MRKLLYLRAVKCVILLCICYQIILMFSETLATSFKVNELEIIKYFSNFHIRDETSTVKYLTAPMQPEFYTSSKRSIKEACFDNSTSSIYGNMAEYIDLILKPVSELYLETAPNLMCFKRGTDIELTREHKPGYCICIKYYYGPNCDIPAAVWHTETFNLTKTTINIRNNSKRIINGFLFNHEFDMLEARLHELVDVVDVFVILECSFTSYGEKKPLRFYDRFVKGYLKEFSHKIIHVYMDKIPDFKNFQGHDVDRLLRCYLSRRGLGRIKGTVDEDIFILSDADEIPSADVVNFLKNYDLPTPVANLTFKWNIYGFFWKNVFTTDIISISTLKYLRTKLQYYANAPRNDKLESSYYKIGTSKFVAGWHCSWCFSPEGIILKMNSAHNADPPRLGDDPSKTNVTFIKECIKQGRYFIDAPPFVRCQKEDYMYAPKYLMENAEKYRTLLEVP